MAKSGVSLCAEFADVYTELKKDKMHSYIILKLSSDKSQIVIDKVGAKGASFEEFKTEMLTASRNKEGRYAVYDVLDDSDSSAHALGKLAFICWLDDNSLGIKEKMLYASSKEVIKQACVGIHCDFNINDETDLNLNEINEKVSKGKKK